MGKSMTDEIKPSDVMDKAIRNALGWGNEPQEIWSIERAILAKLHAVYMAGWNAAHEQREIVPTVGLWQHAEGNVYAVVTDECAVYIEGTWDQPYVLYRSAHFEPTALPPRYYARPLASFKVRFTKLK